MAKLRLKRRRNNIKILLIAVLAFLVLAGIIALTAFVIAPAIQGIGTPKAEGLQITKPNKTVFFTGEVYSSEGMVVELVMKDGTKSEIPIEQCTISGFNSSKPVESQTIRVSYQGYSATYTVTIKADKEIKEPFSIEVVANSPKIEYKLSELSAGVDLSQGKLRVTYVDGTTAEIDFDDEGVSIFGFMGIREPKTYELTVEYVEKGTRVTTTYTITVTE